MKSFILRNYILSIICLIVLAKLSMENTTGRRRRRAHAADSTPFTEVEAGDTFEKIRIHVGWELFTAFVNDEQKAQSEVLAKSINNVVMKKSIELFSSIIKVRPVKGQLKINPKIKQCDKYDIPKFYHEKGVQADLILFPILDGSGEFLFNMGEAAAVYCIQSKFDNRPVVGFIEFNPTLKATTETELVYITWLALHELTHVFVFNDALFGDYVDKNTLKPLGKENVMKAKVVNNISINYVITPKVREKASQHFNCPNAFGVPLENKGDEGSTDGHWHRKAMGPEYMIAKSYGENQISEITLALFEDSGWYEVNYDMANLFLWGKDAGCDFLYCGDCYEKKDVELSSKKFDVETKYKKEYCTEFNSDICSPHHMFRGNCKVGENINIDTTKVLQPFSQKNFGGTEDTADNCPIAIEKKYGQDYYGGSCRHGEAKKSLDHFEKICPSCACIVADIEPNSPFRKKKKVYRIKEAITKSKAMAKNNAKNRVSSSNIEAEPKPYNPSLVNIKASCVEFSCENNILKVHIGNQKVDCNEKYVKVQNFGTITCPDKNIVCHPKYLCRFGCVDKVTDNINSDQQTDQTAKSNNSSKKLKNNNKIVSK